MVDPILKSMCVDNGLIKVKIRCLSTITSLQDSCFKSKEIPKHLAGLRGSQHAVTPLWKAGGVIDILSSELV
jgi:hypothetical protein